MSDDRTDSLDVFLPQPLRFPQTKAEERVFDAIIKRAIRLAADVERYNNPQRRPVTGNVFVDSGRRGAVKRWAATEDKTSATAPARAKFDARFKDEAERRAYFAEMTRKSIESRRRKKAGAAPSTEGEN